MRLPFDGTRKVTTPFAYRWVGVYWKGWDYRHPGVDFGVPQGTQLKAPVTGQVVFASIDKSGFGYGGLVTIFRNAKYYSCAHMSKITVTVGQLVKEGQNIGLSGGQKGTVGAGLSTAAHLHFQVSDSPKINPPFTSFTDPLKLGGIMDRGRAIRLLRVTHQEPTEKRIVAMVGQDEDKWLDGVRASAWFKRDTAKLNAPTDGVFKTKFVTLADKVKGILPFTK